MRPDPLPASIAFCDVETTGLGNHDASRNLDDQPRSDRGPTRSDLSVPGVRSWQDKSPWR